MINLNHIQTVLLDGDGVLWHGLEPVPQLAQFFDVLKERGLNWALITNNATRLADTYVQKFQEFGIEATLDQIVTSATATTHYIQEYYPFGSAFYVVGEHGIKQHLRDVGMVIFDGESAPPQPVEAVIGGLDRQLTYGKITIAARLIRSGTPFFATNPDLTYPSHDGITPGAGTIIAALAAAGGQSPSRYFGKPEPAPVITALKNLEANPNSTIMVGDRMETDILVGIKAGLAGTVLTLDGVTTQADLLTFDYQPSLVCDDLAALTALLEKS